MDYFLLKPFEWGCKLKIVNNDPDILICKMTAKGDMPDFTLHPRPLISDRFKALLEQYLPSMDFAPCILEGKETVDFWTFKPEELPAGQAEFRPDGSAAGVHYHGLLPVFMINNYKKTSYIVNLALAESMLRRSYVNVSFDKIKTLGGEGT